MGIQSFFSSVANIYNQVKSGVSEVFNFGKSIVHSARGGIDWIDKQLDKASAIPFIGTALQEGIDEVRDIQIFGESWNKLKRHISKLDDWVQSGEIEAIGQIVDNTIGSLIGVGEAYGGAADQAFSAGSQMMGGIMS